MPLNQKLTDKPLKASFTNDALVHIVEPNDLTQGADGSDYRMLAKDFQAQAGQDNIDIRKNVNILSTDTYTQILAKINALANYTVNEKQSVWFICRQVTTSVGQLPRTIKYKMMLLGKGNYGTGGTQLTFDNIENIYDNTASLLDIENNPTTDKILYGDLVGQTISEWLNLEDPARVIQPQEDGYTLFEGSIDGVDITYLWIGEGGVYGAGDTQSTMSDFQIISDEIPPSTDIYVSDFDKIYIAQATTANRRYSEADIIKRTDGSYLIGYSKFNRELNDFGVSVIAGKVSSDNGATWGDEIIISPNVGDMNVNSVNFIRINSTTIHCYFLVTNSITDLRVFRTISTDDGLTWATATEKIHDGYGIVLNNSIKRVNSNRLIMPMQSTADVEAIPLVWTSFVYYSDDDGDTWTKSNVLTSSTFNGESSIVYLGGNNILMNMRSTSGFQEFSLSSDNGTTWGVAYVSTLSSTESPAQIVKIGTTLMAIHNPTGGLNYRNPFVISKSLDEGDTWELVTDLESTDEDTATYAYPSITIDGSDVLISYFERKDSFVANGYMSLKFLNITTTEFISGTKVSNLSPDNLILAGFNTENSNSVDPTDSVTEAISKLQGQLNALKGLKNNYTGTGIYQEIVNDAPDNVLDNLYKVWKNTDGIVAAQTGFVSGDEAFYIEAIDRILKLTSDTLIHLISPSVLVEGETLANGNVLLIENKKLGFRYSSGDVGPYQYITANGSTPLTLHNIYTSTPGVVAFRLVSSLGNALDVTTDGNATFLGKASAQPATVSTDLIQKGQVDTNFLSKTAGGTQTVSGLANFGNLRSFGDLDVDGIATLESAKVNTSPSSPTDVVNKEYSDGNNNVNGAGTLALATTNKQMFYTFTGTTSTWTLPVVSGNTLLRYTLINSGSGNITLNSNSGGNDILDAGVPVNTKTIASGAVVVLYNNGTNFVIIP